MSPAQRLAIVVRDLLQQPEGYPPNGVVFLGRNNVLVSDRSRLQIAIDTNGPAAPLTRGEKYDGDAEEMTHSQQWRQPCTIDFYGDEAFDEAKKFALLIQSQVGYELQRDNNVAVYVASSINDVKLLTGERFSARYQLELNVQTTESATVGVLRIDTAQIETTEG